MKKKILFTSAGLLATILLIAGIKGTQIAALISMGETFTEPPMSISSFEVQEDQWESTLSTIGSLEAAKGLVITADLSGRIDKILFDAGSEVKAGDLLIQQDISTEIAQLRSAKTNAELAKKTFDRITEVYNKGLVSKAEYDNAQTTYQSAAANVDNIRAVIERKRIRAPFNGRLGIRSVNLGQTINAGEPVVSLQATRSMFVNFFLPQHLLADVKVGLTVRVRSDAIPNKIFTGKISAIDPKIEEATRSIKIQAILANPEQELLPGMFTSIDVVLPETESVLFVPITAIQYATFGDSVFVIEPANAPESQSGDKPDQNSKKTNKTEGLVARQQFVKLGKTRGDFVTIEKGLSAGEKVASAGVFKLRNGGPVAINNTAVSDFSLQPEVDNK